MGVSISTSSEESNDGLRSGAHVTVTVLRNSFYTLVSTVLSKGFLFLFVVLGANALGPEKWGIFTLATTIVTLLRIFTDYGFQVLITREIAINPGLIRSYLWNTTTIKLLLSLVSILMTILALHVLEFDRVSILVTAIYSIALLPHAFYTSLLAIFNALERMELSGVMQIVMSATHLIVGFLILRWRPDVVVLAFSLPFAMGIASGLGFSILRRIRFALPEFSLSTIRNLLRVGYPFMLVNVLTYVFQKADVLLLSVIKGDAAVGWYGAAYNFLDVIMFLPLAYTVAIFPRLSRAAHHKDEELRNVLIQSLKHLFCFGLFFAVTIAVFADQLILWIYKEAFVNSVVLLRVLILGLVFMFPNSLMGYVLFSKHKQEQLVKVFVVNLAVNVLLNLFAIPKYGPLGAALAMLVSLMSSFLFLIFLVNRYLARLDLSELVLRPIVVASVYLGLLAILYPLNQVLALVVGVVLYLLLYWLSGLLEPEEKQLLCSVCLYPTRKLYLFIRAAIGDNR